ncbi:sporulation integral membrane protein YlbJ [Dethiobacter alkaliphilus]|uniref:sporulation integral membrane protein YlbJ n=1 Tax=Dethiobacter alkaliphilus TaxID=427926 RepID=UPI0022260735|nr:sporulation integral membrane protein YlbJ [Dethiobacter alkaliphilus]MCW3489923.1 sporulation integral membrane protein YlbJ [Dethiobacter alkaliphilus]
MRTKRITKDHVLTYFMAGLGVFLTISMVLFPEDAFAAAVKGLDVWWNIVFPALLPFFIGAELLMGLGVVHFMGVLLQPLMRPIFNVPGVGSFVMAMGLASGFPIGSILTTRLRRDGLCTKVEGERLMSFTNTADPLFMFGAVAVGMFGYPQIGITIAIAHYLSSVSTGILLRFYGRSQPNTREEISEGSILWRALSALYRARKKDDRPMGKLMGDAIRNSVNTLLLIGGFIILFSVIIRIMTVLGIVGIMSAVILRILGPLGLDPTLTPAIISGLFEVTLGTQLAGEAAANVPMIQAVMVAGAIIAWSGLSVHAQVASIISQTDMKVTPFICARFVHACLAAVYTYLLMGPFAPAVSATMPVFANLQPDGGMSFWQLAAHMSWLFIVLTLALLVFSLALGAFKNLKLIIFRS